MNRATRWSHDDDQTVVFGDSDLLIEELPEELGVFEELTGKNDVEGGIFEWQSIRVGQDGVHPRTRFQVDPVIRTVEEIEDLFVGAIDVHGANIENGKTRDLTEVRVGSHMFSNAISEVFQG